MRTVDAETLITPDARRQIVEAIAENNGSEVFFVARTDAALMITEAEAHAYGGKESVPVIMRLISSGDVMVHNHPDGILEPSDADVDVAAMLGDIGAGSYIVDNQCSQIHVIVRPFREEGPKPLNKRALLDFLGPAGPISATLPGYEYRPQQLTMAELVADGFNTNRIAVIEAGTGIGKSFGYLVPALFWSKQNKDRVVVSTNTINLQEQLLHKDLPLLRDRAGLEFKAELMKGRHNYLCLRRLEFVSNEYMMLETQEEQDQLRTIISWAENTTDGSLSDLGVIPGRELWERMHSEADTCLRTHCPHYENCFFYRARRRAARADIIIANHHVVMADLALRNATGNYSASAVLPPFRRIIFDEAHNLEEVATRYFSISVTPRGLAYMLGRLISRSRQGVEKGLLNSLYMQMMWVRRENQSALLDRLIDSLLNEIIPAHIETSSLVEGEFVHVMDEYLSEFMSSRGDPGDELKLRITPAVLETTFWRDTMCEAVKRVAGALYEYSSRLKDHLKQYSGFSGATAEHLQQALIEVASIRERIETAAQNFNFFYNTEEGYCRWIEYIPPRHNRRPAIHFNIAPLDIRDKLRQSIYDVCSTVIMTSATLTVDNRFDFMLDLLGLPLPKARTKKSLPRDKNETVLESRIDTLQLGTPFNFELQAFVGITTDTSDPVEQAYATELESLILQAVSISRGSCLVLFTSNGLMRKLFNNLGFSIQSLGYAALCQGQESRHKLLKRFIEEKNAVLFATASFWEGVDVKGEALRCLIMTRLPFRVPTEPLLEARAEALRESGRDPFHEMDLPMAVIRFRQGFGRLIRSRDDHGAILVFDKRIATKIYGRTFLGSLPATRLMPPPTDKLFEAMKDFFSRRA